MPKNILIIFSVRGDTNIEERILSLFRKYPYLNNILRFMLMSANGVINQTRQNFKGHIESIVFIICGLK